MTKNGISLLFAATIVLLVMAMISVYNERNEIRRHAEGNGKLAGAYEQKAEGYRQQLIAVMAVLDKAAESDPKLMVYTEFSGNEVVPVIATEKWTVKIGFEGAIAPYGPEEAPTKETLAEGLEEFSGLGVDH